LCTEAALLRLAFSSDIAHQSVSQLKDPAVLNTILDNVGTVVAFRSKSKPTEELLVHQFGRPLTQGEIPNLPRHNFYIKITANDPQEPTSGETLLPDGGDADIVDRVISSSRERYATRYEEEESKDNPEEPMPVDDATG
jgi:hypothetical protein